MTNVKVRVTKYKFKKAWKRFKITWIIVDVILFIILFYVYIDISTRTSYFHAGKQQYTLSAVPNPFRDFTPTDLDLLKREDGRSLRIRSRPITLEWYTYIHAVFQATTQRPQDQHNIVIRYHVVSLFYEIPLIKNFPESTIRVWSPQLTQMNQSNPVFLPLTEGLQKTSIIINESFSTLELHFETRAESIEGHFLILDTLRLEVTSLGYELLLK